MEGNGWGVAGGNSSRNQSKHRDVEGGRFADRRAIYEALGAKVCGERVTLARTGGGDRAVM